MGRKCEICGKPATDGSRYCSDCRSHMDYCHEKCDPFGKNGTWDDCEKCKCCEHNMNYVHGKVKGESSMNICKNVDGNGLCQLGASSSGYCPGNCSHFESRHHDLKIFTKNIEREALNQIDLLLSQEAFKDCKVRIMPDVHAGKGCVIGFTADLGNNVIPNIVGVDIGCGMLTVQLNERDIDFERLDNVIRKYIPYGRNVHEGRLNHFDLTDLRCFRDLHDTKRLERSLGTLGGGNHFIEIDTDEKGNKYLVIHTGSRNLGKQVADYYQNLAYELMSGKNDLFEKQEALIAEYKAAGRKSEIQNAIKDLRRNFKAHTPNIPKDLCYLEGKYRENYLHDMGICQQFAELNRNVIADTIISHMEWCRVDSFHTIHNYIDLDSNIVRKGSISAREGEPLLIPINMRDGCILGVGKGNEDWNQSAPHGAGRLMSRMKAKEQLTMEAYQSSMNGIYTTSVSTDTLDEAPMAYKPMQEIIDNIKPTVRILKILKPVYNFKAAE